MKVVNAGCRMIARAMISRLAKKRSPDRQPVTQPRQPERQRQTGEFGNQRGGRAPQTPQPRPRPSQNESTRFSPFCQSCRTARPASAPARPASRSANKVRWWQARPRSGTPDSRGPALDRRRGWCQRKSPGAKRCLQGHQPRPRHRAHDQSPQKDGQTFGPVTRPMRLRRKPRGRHPQEPEGPIQRRQDDHADPTPPRLAASPSWPITAVSTAPKSGAVALESTIGADILRTRRWVIALMRRGRAAASGNARSPVRKGVTGCPARPRHGRLHSADPTGSPAPLHRHHAAGPRAGSRP